MKTDAVMPAAVATSTAGAAWLGEWVAWIRGLAPDWAQDIPEGLALALLVVASVAGVYGGRYLRAATARARADAAKSRETVDEMRTQRVNRISQELYQTRNEFSDGVTAMQATVSHELSQVRSDVQSHTGQIAGHLATIAGQQGEIRARLDRLERNREDDSAVLQAAVLDLSTLNEAVAASTTRPARTLAVERIRNWGDD